MPVPLELKEPAEKTHAAQHFRAKCRTSMPGNKLFGSGGTIDINASAGVGLFNSCLLQLLCPFFPACRCQGCHGKPQGDIYQHSHGIVYFCYPDSPMFFDLIIAPGRYGCNHGWSKSRSLFLCLRWGQTVLDLHFIVDVFVDCHDCGGQGHRRQQTPEASDISAYNQQEQGSRWVYA